MEVSLSFMAWLSVLVFQVLVHLKVVYFRKGRDEDEPRMIEAEGVLVAESEAETNPEKIRESLLTPSYPADPSIDDEFDDDYEDDYDDPPNLRKRLSQTGSEMMSVSEQVLSCISTKARTNLKLLYQSSEL
jgi:hypothetical protein